MLELTCSDSLNEFVCLFTINLNSRFYIPIFFTANCCRHNTCATSSCEKYRHFTRAEDEFFKCTALYTRFSWDTMKMSFTNAQRDSNDVTVDDFTHVTSF